MCTNCDQIATQINIPATGAQGPAGDSAYVYIASADNTSGLNFTYPHNGAQPYIGIINSSTPITSPSASNFTGMWTLVQGTPGTNGTNGTSGTNGIDAGLEYLFLNYATSGNPGIHYLSFNATDTSATSIMAINETTNAGGVINNTLAILGTPTSGNKALMKITKKDDPTKFVLFKVTASVDAGAYFNISVQHLDCSDSSLHKPFSVGDTVIVSFSLSGDNGTQGPQGPAGSFIIGTLNPATANIAYPHPVTYGSAYRFLSNGSIGTALTRVFTNDVLYCHTDTTAANDPSKFFIFSYPRAFSPGAGTDAFIQNTFSPGIASGSYSLALGIGTVAAGQESLAGGTGSNANGTTSFSFGDSCGSDGVGSVSMGIQALVSGVTQTGIALGNVVSTQSDYSTIIGINSTIDASSASSVNIGERNATSAAPNSTVIGYTGKAAIAGEVAVGQGNFGDVTKAGTLERRIIPLSITTTNSAAATNLLALGAGSLVIPSNTVWLGEGRVQAVCTASSAGPAVGDTVSWFFKFQLRNVAGTVSFVDNTVWINGNTGLFATVTTQFAQTASMAACVFDISIAGAVSPLLAKGTGIATATIRWGGQIDLQQLGWF